MPPPDFTVEITALVNTYMTPATGYSAADELIMIDFLVTQIVPLVDPSEIIADYTDPIYTAIQAEPDYNFGVAIDPFKTLLYFLCSETINTIVVPAYSGGGVGFPKVAMGFMNQAGAANPTVVMEVNGLGTALTYVRALLGNFEINASTGSPFLDAEKVELMFSNEIVDIRTRWLIAAPNQIMLEANRIEADLGTGEISGTPDDNAYSDTCFKITIYPS